jgi:hypothetical protein
MEHFTVGARTSLSRLSMPMSRWCLALLLAAAVADGETFFIPVVDMPATAGTGQGESVVDTPAGWYSTITAFNPTGTTLLMTSQVVYGGDGHLASGCVADVQVAPGQGGVLKYFFRGCVVSPTTGPGFVAVEADPGILLTASLQRAFFRCNRCEMGCIPVTLGETSLPVYRGLFAASTTAYAGLINLGAPFVCGAPEEQNLRRVNVTLFNGGEGDARFTIRVLPARLGADPIVETTALLSPKEVLQINKLTIPYVRDGSVDVAGDGLRVWVSVTADQPFLYYVSTPFDTSTPGTIPVQVFEARP